MAASSAGAFADEAWLALMLTDGATRNLWGISTRDGSFRQFTDFRGKPTLIARRVSWSPDGRSIYAAVGEGEGDVMLFEARFREERDRHGRRQLGRRR